MAKLSGQFTQILFDGVDLSGDLNQYEVAFEHAEEDTTGFMQLVETVTPGIQRFYGSFTSFFSFTPGSPPSGAHQTLKDPSANVDVPLSFALGHDGAPEAGEPALMGLVRQFTYTARGTAGKTTIAEVGFNAGLGNVPGYPNGVVLFPPLASPAAGAYTGDTVDNGAATSNGIVIFYHALAIGTQSDIVVEHSPDGTTWAQLASKTITAVGGEYDDLTGTVQRYLRVRETNTGNGNVAVTAARKK